MIRYPLPFKVSAQGPSGIQNLWETKVPHLDDVYKVSIPPEFDGPGGGLSPEDLYAMALQNCFIATFKVFAEKSKLSFSGIRAETQLLVDRNESGVPWMAKVHLNIFLRGVSQTSLAERLLEKTSQSCMILNSVKTEKTFEYHIESL